MYRKILVSFVVLLILTSAASAATTYSAGANYISASNLTLSPTITGGTAAAGADTLYTFNAGVKADFPFSQNGGWLMGAKYDGLVANTNSSINNNAVGVNGGVHFYNQEGHYFSALAKYKYSSYNNRVPSTMNYGAGSIGAGLTGLYNLKSMTNMPLNLVGTFDYDSVSGSATVPGSSYSSLVVNALVGGSFWEGGNLYAGPSFTSISTSPDSIMAGILSVSQQFGKLSGSLSYVYQSKGAATGNLFIVGVNYNF